MLRFDIVIRDTECMESAARGDFNSGCSWRYEIDAETEADAVAQAMKDADAPDLHLVSVTRID